MAIYFAFSDECGSYNRFRSSRFIRSHPFYARATLIIDAQSWKSLEARFLSLKSELQLPADREIKWSYLWSLEKHRRNDESIPQKASYYFLRNIEVAVLQQFVELSLRELLALDYCKVIYTVTDNDTCPRYPETRLLRFHLQELLQRLEMEMEERQESLCVLFADPVSPSRDRQLRQAYSELYVYGDRYKRYNHIKDSLNIEHSHHSVGIQLTDYLAGAFVAFLRGFNFGAEVYRDIIRHVIRRSGDGTILGYGARLVPRGGDYQSHLHALLIEHERG